MKKKIFFKWGGLCVLVLVLMFIGVKYSSDRGPTISDDSSITDNSKIKYASLQMTAGETNVRFDFSVGQSLFEILNVPENKDALALSGKNYEGLGFFVTDIGTLHQGNGKYIFYYINGVESSVGVSAYFPQDGDVVEWVLK